MEYVKGSHKWGKRYRSRTFTDKDIDEENLPEVPDIEAMRGELEILQWELEPGDCVVHHALTLHGGARQQHRRHTATGAGDTLDRGTTPAIIRGPTDSRY